MKPGINNLIDATLEERIDLVCFQGSYIDIRKYCGNCINLYIHKDVIYKVLFPGRIVARTSKNADKS